MSRASSGPRWSRPSAGADEHFKTGLLTNNFVTPLAQSRSSDSPSPRPLRRRDRVLGGRRAQARPPLLPLACATLGSSPDQAVFLDDLGVNLKPARALGMITIKVTDPAEALAELEEIVGIPLR